MTYKNETRMHIKRMRESHPLNYAEVIRVFAKYKTKII